MSEVLDEFNKDIYCRICNKTTEHNVQKIDEKGNGEHIGYYAECDICNHMKQIDEKEINYENSIQDLIDELKEIIRFTRNETRPIDGHTDTGAIEDCYREMDDLIQELEDRLT